MEAKASDVLDLAADMIEKFGWVQGALKRERSRCALQAVADSTCLFGGSYGGEEFVYRVIGGIPITSWNDAPERTRPQVTATLWKAAELARAEGK